jgi:hypothetical protein
MSIAFKANEKTEIEINLVAENYPVMLSAY